MNRTFKPERQNFQILITWNLLMRSWRNFYREYAQRVCLRRWSHGSPNKSKMYCRIQAVITTCTVVQAVLTVWTVVSCSNKFSTKLGNGCWATGAPQKLCRPRTRTTYYGTTYPEQHNTVTLFRVRSMWYSVYGNSYRNVVKLQI